MIKIIIPTVAGLMLMSCNKELTNNIPQTSRIVSDSLLIYQSSNVSGNRGIFSKSFSTGDSVLLVANATAPYVASQRMVYIKAGKTVSYARLNGVSRFLIDLNEPADPSLSIDARSIAIIDKTTDQYQLLLLDTLGNKRVLYQSSMVLKQPEFSTNGQFIFFTQKTAEGNFTIYSIGISAGTALQLVSPLIGVDYTNCAASADRLYFLQTRIINGKYSTEICSVNFSGADFQKHTDFTLNWVQPGFKIDCLRKVNNSTLIFISEYGSNNEDVYIAKTDNLFNHRRMTFSDAYESYPNLIPDFVKDY